MFNRYFLESEVRPAFVKEFISLWSGWLGAENVHKLDEVKEYEWARFNELLRSLAKDFVLEVANEQSQTLTKVNDIELVLSSYEESMNKSASAFTKLVVPALGCVISEDWDYTYIIWHQDNGAVQALAPYISAVGLKHFPD